MTATLLLTAATVLVAPAASAGPGCDPNIPGTCVTCLPGVCKPCLYGYPGDHCLVTNPCDPRYCDPWW